MIQASGRLTQRGILQLRVDAVTAGAPEPTVGRARVRKSDGRSSGEFLLALAFGQVIPEGAGRVKVPGPCSLGVSRVWGCRVRARLVAPGVCAGVGRGGQTLAGSSDGVGRDTCRCQSSLRRDVGGMERFGCSRVDSISDSTRRDGGGHDLHELAVPAASDLVHAARARQRTSPSRSA